jgi:hypothetical protein
MEHECLVELLNPALSVEEKASALSRFFQWETTVGGSMGVGQRFSRVLAYVQLFHALPPGDRDAAQKLKTVLDEVAKYNAEQKARRLARGAAAAEVLRQLESSTPVVIHNYDREEVVRFLRLNRTRFLCEYPDGRRYSVPFQLFVRVHEGKAPAQISEAERRAREFVRSLGGKSFEKAKALILQQGLPVVPVLLAELADAFARIKNAPTKPGRGAFSMFLPPIRAYRAHDVALTKRIPLVIAELAACFGPEHVRKLIAEHPDSRIRRRCATAVAEIQQRGSA